MHELASRLDAAANRTTGDEMKLRMIFCHCLQVGQSRYADRYYTKDIELSGVDADFVRANDVDFVGVELLDEDEQKKTESEVKLWATQ